jgi:hypothetical protein
MSLTPDADFESAIRLISKHHFKKIPVVNKIDLSMRMAVLRRYCIIVRKR